MFRGKFIREFFLLPTILVHRGDGIYTTIELIWLSWFIGVTIGGKDD